MRLSSLKWPVFTWLCLNLRTFQINLLCSELFYTFFEPPPFKLKLIQSSERNTCVLPFPLALSSPLFIHHFSVQVAVAFKTTLTSWFPLLLNMSWLDRLGIYLSSHAPNNLEDDQFCLCSVYVASFCLGDSRSRKVECISASHTEVRAFKKIELRHSRRQWQTFFLHKGEET